MMLSNLVFFDPTKKFSDWLIKLAGNHPIFDLGCGVGRLTRRLRERGAGTIIPIDLHFREDPEVDDIVFASAVNFKYPYDAVLVFARPCHGAWVHDTITNAVKRYPKEILYVGLDRNLETDLGDYAQLFKKVGINAGKAGEGVWRMQKSETGTGVIPGIEKWFLVQFDYYTSWVEDGGPDYWINMNNGRHPKAHGQVVLEEALVTDYTCLDWSKTYLVYDDSDAGWLSPEAKWYPCQSRDHNIYAKLVLKKKPEDLEEAGWAHVYGKQTKQGYDVICRAGLTDAQKSWILENGYRLGYESNEDYDPYDDLALRRLDPDRRGTD